MEPWPFVMMALNRLRNSLMMTPESMPAGGRTAVTEEPGVEREQFQPKRLHGFARGARQHLRILHQLVHAQLP